jgi:hypothetical protein
LFPSSGSKDPEACQLQSDARKLANHRPSQEVRGSVRGESVAAAGFSLQNWASPARHGSFDRSRGCLDIAFGSWCFGERYLSDSAIVAANRFLSDSHEANSPIFKSLKTFLSGNGNMALSLTSVAKSLIPACSLARRACGRDSIPRCHAGLTCSQGGSIRVSGPILVGRRFFPLLARVPDPEVLPSSREITPAGRSMAISSCISVLQTIRLAGHHARVHVNEVPAVAGICAAWTLKFIRSPRMNLLSSSLAPPTSLSGGSRSRLILDRTKWEVDCIPRSASSAHGRRTTSTR